MRIFVLGAGMMGRAVVYDLGGAREVKNVIVADFDRNGPTTWRANSGGARHAASLRTCTTRSISRDFCAGRMSL